MREKPALLLVDIQKGLDEEEYYGGNRNNRNAEENCVYLLVNWRRLHLPVFHIQHSSLNPESPLHASKPGFAIKDEVAPLADEQVIIKSVNSAFIGTGLRDELEDRNIRTVVVAGLTTNHCVSSTARMSANLGFRTIVVSDATATFDRLGPNGTRYSSESVHEITLASLFGEFAEIRTANELLQELSHGTQPKLTDEITIRQELIDDYRIVENVIERAFEKNVKSDHTEHFLVRRLRKSRAFVPQLSLVACLKEQIVGHILLSKVAVINEDQNSTVLSLAPISVLPDFQNKGIGSLLINYAHKLAKKSGYTSVVLIGHDSYYPRFGYRKASEFGIKFPFEADDAYCMAFELQPGALDSIEGMVEYPPEFYEE